jgi:tetrahydromethanopterin S-methyltransferase subunit A
MSGSDSRSVRDLPEALRQLKEATAANKCWGCGCMHGSLDDIERAIPENERPKELRDVLGELRSRRVEEQYECIGCDPCFPPLAVNALSIEGEACPSDDVEARDGWPPLPGSYTVLRYNAPVAVCTLTDESLGAQVASRAGSEIAIVGSVFTENLGIDRIVMNILANPNIRFLLLCGPDSNQKIGHLPGQSMTALARHGLDGRGRIREAAGRRPVLRNVDRSAVEHFRSTVEVVDRISEGDVNVIIDSACECAARSSGPAKPFESSRMVHTVAGYVPECMVSDKAGYFVVYPDRARRMLLLEHYRNDGVLDVVIEGRVAAELYYPAIEKGLISRLDHAAYLGRELARAERALQNGGPYVQGAAPERRTAIGRGCGCSDGSGKERP